MHIKLQTQRFVHFESCTRINRELRKLLQANVVTYAHSKTMTFSLQNSSDFRYYNDNSLKGVGHRFKNVLRKF